MTGERIERKKNSRGGAKGGERIMHPSEIDSRDRKKNRQAGASYNQKISLIYENYANS